MKSLVRCFFAGCFLLLFVTRSFSAESLDQTIDYLLQHIETSQATFIRNGVKHTPAEAAAHVKAKYAHFKGQIKTPEDFIRLSASKSLLTGQPYLVKTAEGQEVHLDAWLREALKAHQAQPLK